MLKWGIYSVIFGFGIIRGFYSPAATSLKPFLIPRELYTNGATWTTIGWQSGVILGPMLGGFMLAGLGRETSLLTVAALMFTCFCLVNLLQKRQFPAMESRPLVKHARRLPFYLEYQNCTMGNLARSGFSIVWWRYRITTDFRFRYSKNRA
jgi:MFS family permease